MSGRITAAELYALRFKTSAGTVWTPQAAVDVTRMLDDLRRLRELIERVEKTPDGWPPLNREDGCLWCDADIVGRKPHAADCPWAAIEAEAEAIRRERGGQ